MTAPLFSLFLLSGWRTAAAADVAYGANAVAMGSTGAADAVDNASITLNPGLLALTERYDFAGQFGVGPTGDLSWAGSGMDGRTSDVLAGGFVYSGGLSEPPLTEDDLPGWAEVGTEIPNKKRLHEFAIGAGAPLLDRRLSVGLGANLQWYSYDRQGSGVGFDTQIGVGARPFATGKHPELLTLGLAVRNFLPWFDVDRNLAVVGGVRVERADRFALEADATWVDRVNLEDGAFPIALAGGGEVAVRVARLRLGGRRDVSGLPWLTAGLGLERDGAAFEYGLGVPLESVALRTTVHTFQIRFSAPEEISEDD